MRVDIAIKHEHEDGFFTATENYDDADGDGNDKR